MLLKSKQDRMLNGVFWYTSYTIPDPYLLRVTAQILKHAIGKLY